MPTLEAHFNILFDAAAKRAVDPSVPTPLRAAARRWIEWIAEATDVPGEFVAPDGSRVSVSDPDMTASEDTERTAPQDTDSEADQTAASDSPSATDLRADTSWTIAHALLLSDPPLREAFQCTGCFGNYLSVSWLLDDWCLRNGRDTTNSPEASVALQAIDAWVTRAFRGDDTDNPVTLQFFTAHAEYLARFRFELLRGLFSLDGLRIPLSVRKSGSADGESA